MVGLNSSWKTLIRRLRVLLERNMSSVNCLELAKLAIFKHAQLYKKGSPVKYPFEFELKTTNIF